MKLNNSQLRNLQFATERLCIEQGKTNTYLGLWQVVRGPLFYYNPEVKQEELTGVDCLRDVSQLGVITALCLMGECSLVTIDLEGLGMTPGQRLLFLGFCNFILNLDEGPVVELENGDQAEGPCPTRRHFVCNCRVPHLFLNLDAPFIAEDRCLTASESLLVQGLGVECPPCRISSAQIHFQIDGPNHVLVTAELVRYARALMTLASSAAYRAIALWNVPGTAGFTVDDEDLEALFDHAKEHPFHHGSVLFHCEA